MLAWVGSRPPPISFPRQTIRGAKLVSATNQVKARRLAGTFLTINIMKNTFTISLLVLMTFSAFGVLLNIFTDYDSVKEQSSDIIVVRCIANPPTQFNSSPTDPDINTFPVIILATIRGTNFPGSASLVSKCWLNLGDYYLIFGQRVGGKCQAIEDFRVIPLGHEVFSAGEITNSIFGKPEGEQLQILFKRALGHASRQIEEQQNEIRRLEGAIRK
jgi:hypothetical protein